MPDVSRVQDEQGDVMRQSTSFSRTCAFAGRELRRDCGPARDEHSPMCKTASNWNDSA
jgi:hypothetical protein